MERIKEADKPKKRGQTMKGIAFLLLLISCVVSACASAPLQVKGIELNQDYEVLGEGKGTASGLLLLDLIPIRLNSRFVRAYDEAVKMRGGDLLLDPVVSDTWRFVVIGVLHSTAVRGTVIKLQ
jgi:hypothetical protein